MLEVCAYQRHYWCASNTPRCDAGGIPPPPWDRGTPILHVLTEASWSEGQAHRDHIALHLAQRMAASLLFLLYYQGCSLQENAMHLLLLSSGSDSFCVGAFI